MQKITIKLVVSSVLLVMFGLYFHATQTFNEHEIDYNPNTAVPLSSLINSLESVDEISRISNKTITSYVPNITIQTNQNVYIDKSLSINKLTIKGNLFCDKNRANNNIKLRVKSLVVEGVFQCGRALDPYRKNLTIALRHNSSLDPRSTMLYRGLIVKNGGKITINGNTKNSGWKKLAQTAMPGDNFIIIDAPQLSTSVHHTEERTLKPTGLPWSIGDKIAIASTSYNPHEAEEFTIIGKDRNNPNKLYLNSTIQYMHWGQKELIQSRLRGNFYLDERAEVANLSRNIKIISDEQDFTISDGNGDNDQLGGHVMLHHGGEAYISAVEFSRLGQAGLMGRYPFHWHHVGMASKQYVKNSSIHHSFQRCITVHRTSDVRLQNNVCYNFKGHGYFLEDGNEVRIKIYNNLGMYAKAPTPNKLLLASDDVANSETQGRFPAVSVFWIAHPFNYVVGNVAAGSVGSGFWMSFEPTIMSMDGTTVVATPLTSKTLAFNHNLAHGNLVGMTWDGAATGALTNNPNNPKDRKLASAHYDPPTTPVFTGNKAIKNARTGIYWRGQTAVFKNSLMADNGWGFWAAYNQVLKDSIVIGETQNKSDDIDEFYYNDVHRTRENKSGIIMYDGPFELYNVDFLNFSTSHETYTKRNGQTIHSTKIPFFTVDGTNKYTNIVSGLHFSPEPIYRAHLEDPSVWRNRAYLGNSSVRDLDGSLSGTGTEQFIAAGRSQGITPQSQCVDGGTSLYNFKVCPANYTEHNFDFFKWGGSASPWATPFVTKRSDGSFNFPISEWNLNRYIPHNKFTLVDDRNYSYELMTNYNYYQDKNSLNTTARVSINAEAPTLNVPIVNIKAYGYNCSLNSDAVAANSLLELKNMNQTSYFSQGDNFFVKLIPDSRWRMIDSSPYNISNAQSTNFRYSISCDNTPIQPEIKGALTGVSYQTNSTIVSGWACEYGQESYVTAEVYAIKENIKPIYSHYRGMEYQEPLQVSAPIFIDSQLATQNPDEATSFKCGKYSSKGRRFNISIPNSITSQYPGHKFYVKVSTANSGSLYLKGSGKYWTIQTRIPALRETYFR